MSSAFMIQNLLLVLLTLCSFFFGQAAGTARLVLLPQAEVLAGGAPVPAITDSSSSPSSSSSSAASAAALTAATSSSPASSSCVSALFTFGDSAATDVGNWALLSNQQKKGDLPFAGVPGHLGGRLSNGRVFVDFVGEELGLPGLLHPIREEGADFSHGASFAVLGATALPASELPGFTASAASASSSLDSQVEQFKQLVSRRCSGAAAATCVEDYVGRALFVLDSMGLADVYHAVVHGGMSLSQVTLDYIPRIAQQLGRAIEQLIDAGAKRFVILAPDLGRPCLSLLCKYTSAQRTDVFSKQDQLLRSVVLQQLQHQNPDAFFLIYEQWLVEPKIRERFAHKWTPCLGGGDNHSPSSSSSYVVCPDPTNYVYWDPQLHHTEAFHQALAEVFVKGGNHGLPVFHPDALLGTVGELAAIPTQSLTLSLGCDSTLVTGDLVSAQAPYRSSQGL